MIAQRSQPTVANLLLTDRNALTTVPWKCRPIASSRIMSGMAKANTAMR